MKLHILHFFEYTDGLNLLTNVYKMYLLRNIGYESSLNTRAREQIFSGEKSDPSSLLVSSNPTYVTWKQGRKEKSSFSWWWSRRHDRPRETYFVTNAEEEEREEGDEGEGDTRALEKFLPMDIEPGLPFR